MFRPLVLGLVIISAPSTLLGQAASSPVAANMQRLRSNDAVDRSRAARALGDLGESAAPAAPALVQALRVPAAVALGDFGADAKDATGPLSALLKGDDSKLQSAAQEALRKITGAKRP